MAETPHRRRKLLSLPTGPERMAQNPNVAASTGPLAVFPGKDGRNIETPSGEAKNRLAGCTGKHRYQRPADVHDVAGRSKVRVEVYRCRFCGGWHVGS